MGAKYLKNMFCEACPVESINVYIKIIGNSNNIIFIADEVVTGFGRMGHIFASEKVFGIIPDIITFAKGVTSGYFPLGGILISNKLIKDLRSLEICLKGLKS